MIARGPHARSPGGDLGDDRLRILGAGVVRGDPRVIREPCGDLAHDRALRSIAIAAAAEDHAQAARGDLSRRREHALEGVRGVSVVDDHQERLAGPHLLEAPGHGADRRERLRDGPWLEAQREPGRHRREQVHHVMLADQRRREREAAARRLDRHPDAVER